MAPKEPATILETGRRNKADGFTLLELLIAMGVLVTALTLIAAGFSRQLFALRLLEGSLTSRHLTEELFLKEALQRENKVDVPVPSVDGFSLSSRWEAVELERSPLQNLGMDLLTAETSWDWHGLSHPSRMVAGFSKEKKIEPSL